MKKILTTVLILFSVYSSIAQSTTDTIAIRQSFGTTFRQDGKKLTVRQLSDIIRSNPEAFEEMKIAKRNYTVSTVLGFASGFLIGWPIGAAVAGGDPKWSLAGIGAGLFAVSLPFNSAFKRHARNAVGLYNRGARHAKGKSPEISLGMSYNGARIKVMF